MNLVKVLSGSRLYGTNTDFSDWDVLEVFLEPKSCILGLDAYPKNTQVKDEFYDLRRFPLKSFLKLAREGHHLAIETLFAPPITHTLEWTWLRDLRHLFLSKAAVKKYLSWYKSSGRVTCLLHAVYMLEDEFQVEIKEKDLDSVSNPALFEGIDVEYIFKNSDLREKFEDNKILEEVLEKIYKKNYEI